MYLVNPLISDGNISEVNCILLKSKFKFSAISFAKVVFPVPGWSSSKILPPARIEANASCILSSLPTIFLFKWRMSFLVIFEHTTLEYVFT